tara:strand:+ start:3910 stop:5196 length:1287 start_codon:yes stop_codon:yes gene_type:complete
MKKKVLVVGPTLSQSGYGVHARTVLNALRSRQDVFDIYIHNLNWGHTSWLWEDTEDRRWIDATLLKTVHHRQNNGTFDLSLQVTIPNEWEKVAPINIGCTAGIETNLISPVWVEKSYMMDKIIVVSEFAKQGFVNTVYEAINQNTQQPEQVSAKGPIDVINYPLLQTQACNIELDLKHDFNFLTIAQWSPRKNLENTIRWFIEEFHDQEVGLVVKTSTANNSYMDRLATRNNLKKLLGDPKYSERICSLHFLHGYLKDEEMSALYQDSRIKALVNIAHGEGYGLPIFEMAGHGKPIITTAFGGQTDFLYVPEKVKGQRKKKLMPKFAEVEFKMAPVQQEAVWDGVLQADSQWAYADPGSYKMKLRDVYKKYSMHEKRAKVLQSHIIEHFTEQRIYTQFVESIGEVIDLSTEEFDVEEWLEALNVETHE